MKTCVLCGKQFQPRVNAQRVCDDVHYRECKFCGTQFVIKKPSDSQQCCSKSCTAKLRERTMIDRYGVSHALQHPDFLKKSEDTQLDRYGVKHASQNEQIKQKTRQMFLDRYGVSTPFQMEDFQHKSTQTCLERYGVEYTSQIPGRTEKMQATNLDRYGSVAPMGNAEIQERFRQDMLEKHGVPYYCMTEDCRSKQKQTISSFNKIVMDKLADVGLKSVPEHIVLERYSYDIYVPDVRTVIEVNPTDTHNAIKNPWADVGLPKNYHRDKTKLATDNGYRCINIWDWDSVDKVVKMLQPKSTIYARKCTVSEIDATTASVFENIHHLQGKVRGQQICLGLYYCGELVQLMTFGKPRYNKKYEWELLRLCSNSRYAVVGGAERLWRYFLKTYSPTSVISYCDASKFNGGVYLRLGMELSHVTEPNKLWSKGIDVITNNLLIQRGYDQIFHTHHGKGTSNEELMIENGWLPVYDCGQSVFTFQSLYTL